MLSIISLLGVALASVLLIDTNSSPDDEAQDTLTPSPETGGNISGAAESPTANLYDDADTTQDVTLNGGNADDTIHTGAGNDTLSGGRGDDVLDADAGADVLHGGQGDDTLQGGANGDRLYGDGGDDALFGDDHGDHLYGGEGDDMLDGGAGDDVLLGMFGQDTLIGGSGADVLKGGAADDVLIGNDDTTRDELYGGAGDDIIHAGAGDYVSGGRGDDVIQLTTDAAVYVDDYNADDDSILVYYDSDDLTPELSVSSVDQGLALWADNDLVATFGGISVLDMGRIALVPM